MCWPQKKAALSTRFCAWKRWAMRRRREASAQAGVGGAGGGRWDRGKEERAHSQHRSAISCLAGARTARFSGWREKFAPLSHDKNYSHCSSRV
jgi:hypothetical protein